MKSNKTYRIAVFALVGLLVMLLGGLAGWYVVLKQKGQTISFGDAARGFGFNAPSAEQNGSTYSNIGGGGGFAIGGGSGVGGENGINAATNGTNGELGDVSGGEHLSDTASTSSIVGGTGTSTAPKTIVYKTPRLWRISKTPVAGFVFATGTPAIYFADRATGNLMRADVVSGEVTRRTNTLIPKIYQAYLQRDGSSIFQTINETTGALETFNGAVSSSTTGNTGALLGINLKNNLTAFDANPDSKTIFYLIQDGSSFSAFTQPWVPGKNSVEKKVFSSGLGGWKLFALTDGRLMVAEKPHDGIPGYAYEILPSGRFNPLVRSAPGLTFLPLSGNRTFLFSTSANGALALFAQTPTTTLALPVRTVADKCVWSPYKATAGRTPATDLVVYCAVPRDASVQNFLENWYMGALHTEDSWWRINLTNGKTDQILAGDVSGGFDVVDPTVDPSGSVIAFKNGIDGSLWTVRIVK